MYIHIHAHVCMCVCDKKLIGKSVKQNVGRPYNLLLTPVLNMVASCINPTNSDQAGRPKCPMDPYFIVPDKCRCVDFQMLKLQESPDAVPNGELPRHIQLYCDRYLTDKVVPGNRVTVVGIYAIKKLFAKQSKVSSSGDRVRVCVRALLATELE